MRGVVVVLEEVYAYCLHPLNSAASLKEERAARKRWAKARLALIAQFNDEGTKLADILQDGETWRSPSSRPMSNGYLAEEAERTRWREMESQHVLEKLRKENDEASTFDLLTELRAATRGTPSRSRRSSTRVSPVTRGDSSLKVGPLSPPLFHSKLSTTD